MNEEIMAVQLASGLKKRKRTVRVLLGTPLIYIPIIVMVLPPLRTLSSGATETPIR